MHSSTHSSQMNTVGPAISLRTSCWLLPQKEQYSVLLVSPLAAFVIVASLLDGARPTWANVVPVRPFPPDHAGYAPGVV